MPRVSPNSTYRRYKLYRILRSAPLAMRPCARCVSRGLECRTAVESESDKCGECMRVSPPCSLVVTPQEFALVNSQLAKLESELARARVAKEEAKDRTWRLKSQRQKILERKGEMVDRASWRWIRPLQLRSRYPKAPSPSPKCRLILLVEPL
jgi:hypothetical protein